MTTPIAPLTLKDIRDKLASLVATEQITPILRPDDTEALRAAVHAFDTELLAAQSADNQMIETRSIIAAATGAPFVILRWGSRRAQLSPLEARAFANTVMATAEAAIADVVFHRWLTEIVGMPAKEAGQALVHLRHLRAEYEPQMGDDELGPA